MIRRWKLLLGVPLGLAVLAALVSLILAPVYTAQTTLTAAASSSPGALSSGALASLAGLAGQLGVSGAAGGSLSPDFIADVLKSREVLTETVESRFPDPAARTQQRPLLDLLDVRAKSEAARVGIGVRKLGKMVKTKVDHSTGIVTLMVKAGDPELAAAIGNRLVQVLNSFNLERRKSQSREQARFTKERLAQAEAELHEAETAQLRFLQSNRVFIGSPILEFENSRLRRAVELKQEVYVSLAKSYDDARIAEVRDTPVITTIDSAVPPDQPSAPRILLNVIIGLLLGGILALGLVFVLEQRGRLIRSAAPGYQDLRQTWNAVRGKRPAASERGSAAAEL